MVLWRELVDGLRGVSSLRPADKPRHSPDRKTKSDKKRDSCASGDVLEKIYIRKMIEIIKQSLPFKFYEILYENAHFSIKEVKFSF